jgi:DNA polymerase III alpha subunit (gram-positive type)
MIENILIIDTETTGLSPTDNKLIEVCGILYNLEHRAILQIYSTLLPCQINEAERFNNILAEVTRLDYALESVYLLEEMSRYAQALVAHNAKFDKAFIENNFSAMRDKKWICTMDFPWPVELQRRRLQDVCEAMDVEYKNAHRAFYDCMLLVECFNKVEDLKERFNS